MKGKFLKQTEREYSATRRITALAIEGLFFLGALPFALTYYSSALDTRLDFPKFTFGAANIVIGISLILIGFLFACWAIYVQFTVGRGTPVPIMATQKLIIQKPYNYCRNPMALGTIVLYLGAAILLGSISAVILVFAGTAFLLAYIKIAEEKEMEMRFGEAYQKYKIQTPFILPRFWNKE